MSAPIYKENNGKLAGHEDEYYVLIYLYSHIINRKLCGKITVLNYFLHKGHRF